MTAELLPNPDTDAIRRFTVVGIDRRAESQRRYSRKIVHEWRVRDRCRFLPDVVFKVELPPRGGAPSDHAIAAAKARADRHRRNLNWCEAFDHHFDVLAERCVTCGVRP